MKFPILSWFPIILQAGPDANTKAVKFLTTVNVGK